MPSPLKIGLFTQYHSEMHCKECLKQSAAHHHAIMPQQPRTISTRTDTALSDRPRRNDSAVCNPAATDTDRQTAPTKSARNDHTKPEQLVTVSPRRIFRCSPVRGLYSRCNALLLPCKVYRSASFLRLFFRIAPNVYLWKFTKQRKPRIC